MTKLMKDVFELPMVCEDGDGYIYSNDLRHSIKFDDTDLNCMAQKRAVSKAINSYDTLTEQNKQLTQLCRNILDAHEVFDGAAHIDEDSLEDYREMLFKILAKHKEQICQ